MCTSVTRCHQCSRPVPSPRHSAPACVDPCPLHIPLPHPVPVQARAEAPPAGPRRRARAGSGQDAHDRHAEASCRAGDRSKIKATVHVRQDGHAAPRPGTGRHLRLAGVYRAVLCPPAHGGPRLPCAHCLGRFLVRRPLDDHSRDLLPSSSLPRNARGDRASGHHACQHTAHGGKQPRHEHDPGFDDIAAPPERAASKTPAPPTRPHHRQHPLQRGKIRPSLPVSCANATPTTTAQTPTTGLGIEQVSALRNPTGRRLRSMPATAERRGRATRHSLRSESSTSHLRPHALGVVDRHGGRDSKMPAVPARAWAWSPEEAGIIGRARGSEPEVPAPCRAPPTGWWPPRAPTSVSGAG